MTTEQRRRRLAIRSRRRGTREMDLILGRFWEAAGAGLDDAAFDLYEALLAENDQDLYLWVSGQADPPDGLAPLVGRIRDIVGGR